MMAVAAPHLPTGGDWTYEVKWDGYRALAIADGSRRRMLSRNLKDLTGDYPSLAPALARVPDGAILDGEIVALNADGRPSFQALQHRATGALHVAYYVFDLLHLGSRDLAARPLEDRRRELARIELAPPFYLSEPLPGSVTEIEAAVRRLGLEGVVAKKRRSRYEAGKRSDSWVKVKFSARQEFVVGGYKPAGDLFDSLLVGYYDGRALKYAGKVRAGLTPYVRAAVFDRIAPFATPRCPFVNLPTGKTSHWGEGITAEDMKTLKWIRPRVVVEVAFTEWTRDASLRHASFVGVREDKDPRTVRRET